MKNTVRGIAEQIIDIVPLVMRSMRAKLHEQRAPKVTVHQFRAMLFINRNHGTFLSDVAIHVGVSLPTMSVLIDKLVDRNLVSRDARGGGEDRRKMCLSLTPQGQDQLNVAYEFAQEFLIGKMSRLSTDELLTISQAMQILQGLFAFSSEKQPIIQAEQ